MPDVGIVMPVYNQDPSYLRTALRSILKQTYRNYRFVIVVDGASEETRKIVEQETLKDQRTERIVKEKNEGVPKALNTGFDRLRNYPDIHYYTWVSSDNIYYPAFLATLRSTIVKAPDEVGIVYSSFRHVNGRGQPRKDINLAQFRKYQNQSREKILDFCFIGASFMYKRIYADPLAGYWAEPVEDYEYWLRLTEKCDVRYVPVELMDYREESSHSISARLKNSIGQHRKWRDTNQLVKFQARERRGIALETTVFFLLQDGDNNILPNVEKVLDQLYEGYRFVIVDLSSRNLSENVVTIVSDPRIETLKYPGIETQTALRLSLSKTSTPFSIFYRVTDVPSSNEELTQLVASFREYGKIPTNPAFAATHLGNRVRARQTPESKEPVFTDLYQTAWLKKHLGQA